MTTNNREAIVVEKLALSPEEFKKNYLYKNRPVVLTNATEHWSALGKFTPDFFKQNYPNIEIKVQGTMYKLGDYIDLMLTSTEQNPAPYPCKLQLTSEYTDLIKDVSPRYKHVLPDRVGSKIIPRKFFSGVDNYEIFFGGPGGWFPYIHYDVLKLHAIINQVYGEKQFTIWRPDQAPFMYVNPDNNWQSLIKDYHIPDYEKYPLFKNALSASVTIGPGETMFVPCGWWHTARSLTPTISVAFDLLNSSNWDEFVDEVMMLRGNANSPKAMAAKAFLKTEGVVFNMMESLGIKV